MSIRQEAADALEGFGVEMIVGDNAYWTCRLCTQMTSLAAVIKAIENGEPWQYAHTPDCLIERLRTPPPFDEAAEREAARRAFEKEPTRGTIYIASYKLGWLAARKAS